VHFWLLFAAAVGGGYIQAIALAPVFLFLVVHIFVLQMMLCGSGAKSGMINLKIDKKSPKVATIVTQAEEKKVYCRCWKSKTFPYCDGSHVKHNEETGDNVGPLIVKV
jgi:CDGSH-type Zn-finger protein